MNKALRISVAVGAILAIAGCATTPSPTQESEPVPADRILAKGRQVSREGAGRLVVKRDSGFSGGGCTFRLYANGEPLADFRPGEVATFYVEPGEIVVGAQARGFCGAGDSETGITLKPGQTKTLRISLDNGAAVRISPTAF